MKIKYKCLHCQATFEADDFLNGRQVRCPKCREVFRLTANLSDSSSPSHPQNFKPSNQPQSGLAADQQRPINSAQNASQNVKRQPEASRPNSAQQTNPLNNNPLASQPVQPFSQQLAASPFENSNPDSFNINDLESLVSLEKSSIAVEQQSIPRAAAKSSQSLQPAKPLKKKSQKSKDKKARSSGSDIIDLRNQYFIMLGIMILVLILGLPLVALFEMPLVTIIFSVTLLFCELYATILYIKLTYRLWGTGGAILCWFLGHIPLVWIVICVMIFSKQANNNSVPQLSIINFQHS